ncbi:hypothetical protein NVSP9465_03904 [Novosphingobium sp. CECT 9465]|jgi:hypothetical protein|nr:hypothetical protein NVSP9465_03904 [Novosphingobium sp. CECT 9465]
MLRGPDRDAADWAQTAMMPVTKIDIAALEAESMLLKCKTALWGWSNVRAMISRKAWYNSMG